MVPDVIDEQAQPQPGPHHGVLVRRAESQMPGCLILFLHGMLSETAVWNEWHGAIESRIGPIDAFMFSYKSKLGHKACIAKAADDLLGALQTGELADYRHVFAVTHSTGGLILKAACQIDFERHFGKTTGTPEMELPAETHVSDVYRTGLLGRLRTISNLSVPHRGGNWYTTIPGFLLYTTAGIVYYAPAELADYVARLRGKRPDVGYFRLAYQLIWKSPLLDRLEREYQRIVMFLDKNDLGFPVSRDYLGNRDPVVPPPQFERIIHRGSVRGTPKPSIIGIHNLHSLLPEVIDTLPQSLYPFSPALQQNRLGNDDPLFRYMTIVVATESIRLHAEADRDLSIQRLISGAGGGDERSQASYAKRLHGVLRATHLGCQIVLTGPVGVGKSSLLRRLARRLLNDALAGITSAPFPITFNLREARELTDTYERLNARAVDTDFWSPLERWWISAALKLGTGPATTGVSHDALSSWLHNILKNVPVVVVLDGMDEFITQIHGADLDLARRIADDLRRSYPQNKRIDVIFGIRDGYAGTEKLASRAELLLTLGHLAPAEAAAFFGEKPVTELLTAIGPNSPFEALVLSPLVLATLTRAEAILQPARLDSLSGILDSALEAIIASMPLGAGGGTRSPSLEAWKYMLAILCWCLSTRTESYVTERWVVETLRHEADKTLKALSHLNQAQHASIDEIRDGLRLCLDADAVAKLLRNTVFVNHGARFYPTHQEWIDLGLARYLEIALKLEMVQEFGRRTFYPTVFVLAAELINDHSITQAFLAKAFQASHGMLQQFIAGNIAAILNWSYCPLDDAALEFLFGNPNRGLRSNLDTIPALAKHIWFGALLFRAIAGRRKDSAAGALKNGMLDVLNEHFFGSVRLDLHPNTEHLAWCGLRILRSHDQLPQPKVPLKPLSQEETYRFACPGAMDQNRSEPHIKSLIVGYARAATWLLVEKAWDGYVFGSLHYAWMACCAIRSGERSGDAENALDALLDTEKSQSAKQYQDIIQLFRHIPELRELDRQLRALYSRSPASA